jgi:hypothetical protein
MIVIHLIDGEDEEVIDSMPHTSSKGFPYPPTTIADVCGSLLSLIHGWPERLQLYVVVQREF